MIVFNLGAKGGMSLDGPTCDCLVGALATVETRSARTLVARENLMSFAPVVPKAWVLGSLLAAASPAHALVELEAVIRPSVAATQRAWFYCALGAARDLRAGIERFQTAAHIAERTSIPTPFLMTERACWISMPLHGCARKSGLLSSSIWRWTESRRHSLRWLDVRIYGRRTLARQAQMPRRT